MVDCLFPGAGVQVRLKRAKNNQTKQNQTEVTPTLDVEAKEGPVVPVAVAVVVVPPKQIHRSDIPPHETIQGV